MLHSTPHLTDTFVAPSSNSCPNQNFNPLMVSIQSILSLLIKFGFHQLSTVGGVDGPTN